MAVCCRGYGDNRHGGDRGGRSGYGGRDGRNREYDRRSGTGRLAIIFTPLPPLTAHTDIRFYVSDFSVFDDHYVACVRARTYYGRKKRARAARCAVSPRLLSRCEGEWWYTGRVRWTTSCVVCLELVGAR